MNESLLEQLQATQQDLDPKFKALRSATAALRNAVKQASEEHADALAMQKVLAKLQQATETMEDDGLQAATDAFASATQDALGDLAFHFARDLKEVFEERGQPVDGRPPTLVVGELALQIDITARKAQWLYGKEPLTRPIPLSINTIIKAYDRQHKSIIERKTDIPALLQELYAVWLELLAERSQTPPGKRINLIETYARVIMNRQTPRFKNSPSRSTFKDYERAHFVRDSVLAQEAPTLEVDDKIVRLRLGIATKSQADSAMRSVWLPRSALDGEYYANITFE